MKSRIRIIQSVFLLWSFFISVRLVYWQIVKAGELRDEAQFQQTNRLKIDAPRGSILASDGFPLVESSQNYLLYLNPTKLTDPHILEDHLKELPASESSILALKNSLSSKLQYAIISKGLNKEQKEKFESLKIPGLGFTAQPTRIYPEGSTSAYITGFVGRDQNDNPQGYFGLEGFYNRQLSGVPGRIIEEKDARGMPIIIGQHLQIPSQPGSNLITSIDRVVQYVAFKKLSEGLEKFQAASGTVTILDAQTGRVLGMVALPSYDPLSYSSFSPSLYKNPIVSATYEPGSTFKTIVMASGLDAKAIKPDSICTNCAGPLVISGQTVRNYDDKYYKNTNMTDIILHSDNIGMVYVAGRLGKNKFLDYLKQFGIGKPTGIDLQEESISELRPTSDWYDIDWSTASFGQGIAVTPLQMTMAVNCLARGGECISPQIVKDIQSGSTTQSPPSPSKWRAVGEDAASMTTDMMVNGVENGPVKIFKPSGFKIAGKTGTAQVAIEGHYDADKTIASFVGFGPVPKPKFTMLVTVREPKTSPWGSTTAAPIWFEIASELLRYYRIPSEL